VNPRRDRGRPELARARQRRGLSQEGAADAIGVSATTWARWERGEQGIRPIYRARIAELWQVPAEELERWLETDPAETPATSAKLLVASSREDGSASPLTVVDEVSRLWRWEMDSSRRHVLAALPFASAALAEWLLSWRYDPPQGPAGHDGPGPTVGMSDVQRVHEAHQAFVQMDQQFGAGLVRPAVTDFMNYTLAPLLRGSYTERVGAALMSAAARMTRLAGWMAFDLGHQGQAQQHFGQALKLAKAGDDTMTAAWVLAALAQQACDLGQGRWAVRLARAAGDAGRQAHASPRIMAHLLIRQARAVAVAADNGADQCDQHAVRQVTALISEAERAFASDSTDLNPPWNGPFGEAELAAETGYCWQRIGEHRRAAHCAEEALRGFGGRFPRSEQFNRVHAAEAYLSLGELDKALTLAREAVPAAKELTSARSVAIVRDFSTKLKQHRPTRQVREFDDYLHAELAG
jgi:transcriptional regulator with XRE-family HTH domain